MLHDSILFFPLAPCFTTFLLGHVQKSRFGQFWRVFRQESLLGLEAFLSFCLIFFHLSFFSYSDLFATVIDLLGLLPVQKFLRKHQ